MFYGCPKENSFPSFVDAPKAPKSFLFFCLLRRKILFHGFSDFFHGFSDFFRRLVIFCFFVYYEGKFFSMGLVIFSMGLVNFSVG